MVRASRKNLSVTCLTLFLVSFLGILVAYIVHKYIITNSHSPFTLESLNLSPAQFNLLAELGIDKHRLYRLFSSLNAFKLFFSSSIDNLFDSFFEMLQANKDAAGRLYHLASAHAEQYSLAVRLLSVSFPRHAMRLKSLLQKEAGKGINNIKMSGEDALKEWKSFIKNNQQGKAMVEWMRAAWKENKVLVHAATTALPQRVVEWCEHFINQLLE